MHCNDVDVSGAFCVYAFYHSFFLIILYHFGSFIVATFKLHHLVWPSLRCAPELACRHRERDPSLIELSCYQQTDVNYFRQCFLFLRVHLLSERSQLRLQRLCGTAVLAARTLSRGAAGRSTGLVR